MSLQTTWGAWTALSIFKRAAIATALVLGLLVMGWGIWGIVGWATGRHDRKFDEARAQEAAQRKVLEDLTNQLTIERNEAIARAEAKEKEAEDLRAQAEIKDLALAAAGVKVQGIDDKLMEEDARYIKELEASGRDATLCERIIRNCENAIRLGIRPKSKPCTCD